MDLLGYCTLRYSCIERLRREFFLQRLDQMKVLFREANCRSFYFLVPDHYPWSGGRGRVHFAVCIYHPLSRLTGICVCDVEMYTLARCGVERVNLPCSGSDQLITTQTRIMCRFECTFVDGSGREVQTWGWRWGRCAAIRGARRSIAEELSYPALARISAVCKGIRAEMVVPVPGFVLICKTPCTI